MEVTDSSAVRHTLHGLDRRGADRDDKSKGACGFGITSEVGSLVLGYLGAAKRLGPNSDVSLSFSRRFVPTNGGSARCSCGGTFNCFPKITSIKNLVINVRGQSNGAGIGFRRGSALRHVFRELRSRTEILIHGFETSYNSFSRSVIAYIVRRYRHFCVETGGYKSHEASFVRRRS